MLQCIGRLFKKKEFKMMNTQAIQNATPLANGPQDFGIKIASPSGVVKEFHAGGVEKLTESILADDISIELGFRDEPYPRAWAVMNSNICIALSNMD